MNLRLSAALAAGKAAGLASRMLRRGGGTTMPGVVARRIAPDTLRQLSARLPQGVVVVGGTNGKTTTARMIAAILQADGQQPLHNRAGANLLSGLTSTMLAGASLSGRLRADRALFETDEAALPDALAETQPRLVLLHNLFRDQLDRYGEVDTIAQRWRAALAQLPPSSTVLLNADDPAIADLGTGLAAQVRFYGLADARHASDATAYIADSQFCQRCGAAYDYAPLFYAHIGHYRCPHCGHARPEPEFSIERLDLDGTTGSRMLLRYPDGALELQLPLPGMYNALNALAATAAALLLGVPPARTRDTLERFSAAFGRIERIDAAGKPLFMALIKNPVGASETVRMLTQPTLDAGRWAMDGDTTHQASGIRHQASEKLFLLVAINDRHADGTDVSWLWDADFEQLGGRVAHAVVSGTRAADMAVRLKYAGVEPAQVQVEPKMAQALDVALAVLPDGATLYALPTYTAMLELRAELARRGWVRPFWED